MVKATKTKTKKKTKKKTKTKKKRGTYTKARAWTDAEDNLLWNLNSDGNNAWSSFVPSFSNRSRNDISSRWRSANFNHKDAAQALLEAQPKANKTRAWTDAEDDLLWNLNSDGNNAWSSFVPSFSNRSRNDISHRWRSVNFNHKDAAQALLEAQPKANKTRAWTDAEDNLLLNLNSDGNNAWSSFVPSFSNRSRNDISHRWRSANFNHKDAAQALLEAQPKANKTRAWTDAEDNLLLNLNSDGNNAWSSFVPSFSNRSRNDISHRWRSANFNHKDSAQALLEAQPKANKTRAWTDAEDNLLLNLNSDGNNAWSSFVPSFSNRSRNDISHRWRSANFNHKDSAQALLEAQPKANKTRAWTDAEDNLLLNLNSDGNNAWSSFVPSFSNRSRNDIRDRWRSVNFNHKDAAQALLEAQPKANKTRAWTDAEDNLLLNLNSDGNNAWSSFVPSFSNRSRNDISHRWRSVNFNHKDAAQALLEAQTQAKLIRQVASPGSQFKSTARVCREQHQVLGHLPAASDRTAIF